MHVWNVRGAYTQTDLDAMPASGLLLCADHRYICVIEIVLSQNHSMVECIVKQLSHTRYPVVWHVLNP